MPELPEVEVTRRAIEPLLVGRRISEVKTTSNSYLFITRNVVPKLKELGATEEDIQNIFVNNPRNFFEAS